MGAGPDAEGEEGRWGNGGDAIIAAGASIAERGAATRARAFKPKELIVLDRAPTDFLLAECIINNDLMPF